MEWHETYVSLETAKLLKQAGFDWEVQTCYDLKEGCSDTSTTCNWNVYDDYASRPPLSMVQTWIREVKNVDVTVSRAMAWNQFYYTIEHEENRTSKIDVMSLNDDLWWFKYEDALEAGIKKYLTDLLHEGN